MSILIYATLIARAAAGDMVFQYDFGGSGNDEGRSVQQTADGGYVIAGTTDSFGNGSQVYLIKASADGRMEWQKNFGGSGNDEGRSVQQTADGGYVIAGITDSFGNGSRAYLIKTGPDGTVEWQDCYGIDGNESGNSVQQTADGGYVIAGTTGSPGNAGRAFLVKTRADGTLEWQGSYGTDDRSYDCNAVRQAGDGGYVIAGTAYNRGDNDYQRQAYLARIRANGTLEWRNHFYEAGQGQDHYCTGYSVEQAGDGGYVLSGQANIEGYIKTYLVKTTASGTLLWQNYYDWQEEYEGGIGYSVKQAGDGGYVIASQTWAGSGEIGLVKTSSDGTLEWMRSYGGGNSGNGAGRSVGLTTDGGYVLAGVSDAFGNGSQVYLLKVYGRPGPVAGFTSNMTGGLAPLTVQFNDTSMGSPASWRWDFGDGATDDRQNATHTYTIPGSYTVNLTVSDGNASHTATKANYIRVTVPGTGTVVNERTGQAYDSIQAAIDDATTGDTIRAAGGTYTENIVVNKTIRLIGNDTGSGMPVVDGNGGTAILIRATGASLQGFNVTNSSIGIYVYSNTCVTGNYVNKNRETGIFLYGSGNNVSGNKAGDNNVGIYLYRSSGNAVSGNDAGGNRFAGLYLLKSSGGNRLWNNTANNNNYGIFCYGSDDNSLEENTADGNYYGIYLYRSDGNAIARNPVKDGNVGIYLHGCRNNLSGNTANGNNVGLCISTNSSDNRACGNIVSDNSYGIYVYGTSDNRIWSNVVERNTLNAYATGGMNYWNSGVPIEYSYDSRAYTNFTGNFWGDYPGIDGNGDGIGDTPYRINAIEIDNYPMLRNMSTSTPGQVRDLQTGRAYTTIQAAIDDVGTAEGDTILVNGGIYRENVIVTKSLSLIGQDDPTVDGGLAGNCFHIGVNDVTVKGFTVANSSMADDGSGIYADNVENCSIVDNIATNNMNGIWLIGSSNDTIAGNSVYNNSRTGIEIMGGARNNVTGNKVNDNAGAGFFLQGRNNSISDNTASNNSIGFYLAGAFDDHVVKNNVSHNRQDGIYIASSSHNNMTENVIKDNFEAGIEFSRDEYDMMGPSTDNTLVNNVLAGNGHNAIAGPAINQWNSTAPREFRFNNVSFTDHVGNYWGDYTGPDADRNGVGDVPYEIDPANIDRYPMLLNASYGLRTDFSSDVTSGPAPLTVRFNDTSLGSPASWRWDFGDGATDDRQNATHTYTTPGSYTVSLTVSDGNVTNTMTKARHIWVITRGTGLVVNERTNLTYGAIQAAIDDANTTAGDTIRAAGGTYVENIVVNKTIRLIGNDTDGGMPIVDGNGGAWAIKLTADGIILQGFTMTNASEGIYVESNFNTLKENVAVHNGNGIYLIGEDIHHNTLTGNIANDNGDDGIVIQGGRNDNLTGNTANNNSLGGINILGSGHNTLSENTADGNAYGIIVYADPYGSGYDRLANNRAYGNRLTGITLSGTGSDVSGNMANGNGEDGIMLQGCRNDHLSGNVANNNTRAGIRLEKTDNTHVAGNMVRFNGMGIFLDEASDNILWANLFEYNNDSVSVTSGGPNQWSSNARIPYTYKGREYASCIGNYWDDYEGADADDDGIGDTHYAIDSNNEDSCPLMVPMTTLAA